MRDESLHKVVDTPEPIDKITAHIVCIHQSPHHAFESGLVQIV